MTNPIRNRIKCHRRVRAGDLVPHELNWRTHPPGQRAALRDLYKEVGFARSLLAYELPDGRLKLIDGHLRRDINPNMLVDVEVLDVTEDEARTLLLSMDPLAGLAGTDSGMLDQLRNLAETDSQSIQELWDSLAPTTPAIPEQGHEQPIPEQYLVLVECEDEQDQVRLLQRFQEEGLTCRALMS